MQIVYFEDPPLAHDVITGLGQIDQRMANGGRVVSRPSASSRGDHSRRRSLLAIRETGTVRGMYLNLGRAQIIHRAFPRPNMAIARAHSSGSTHKMGDFAVFQEWHTFCTS
jgi:hypothetical protein